MVFILGSPLTEIVGVNEISTSVYKLLIVRHINFKISPRGIKLRH